MRKWTNTNTHIQIHKFQNFMLQNRKRSEEFKIFMLVLFSKLVFPLGVCVCACLSSAFPCLYNNMGCMRLPKIHVYFGVFVYLFVLFCRFRFRFQFFLLLSISISLFLLDAFDGRRRCNVYCLLVMAFVETVLDKPICIHSNTTLKSYFLCC